MGTLTDKGVEDIYLELALNELNNQIFDLLAQLHKYIVQLSAG